MIFLTSYIVLSSGPLNDGFAWPGAVVTTNNFEIKHII